MIRDATLTDAERIAEIYNYFIAETVVSFEEETLGAKQIAERIQDKVNAGFPWLVYERAGLVVGYAYAGPWHPRCAYRKSVETSIYLSHDIGGRGIGSQLYGELISRLRQLGFHTLIGGIALPNEASVALHEKFGFRRAAYYQEVGFKFGRWIDVGYWQLMLEETKQDNCVQLLH